MLCSPARLGNGTYTLPVKSKGARLQRLRHPRSSGLQGAAGDVQYRLLLSGRKLLHVPRLARVLLPALVQLLRDVQAHPGFSAASLHWQPAELLRQVASQGPLLTPHAQVRALPSPPSEGSSGCAQRHKSAFLHSLHVPVRTLSSTRRA